MRTNVGGRRPTVGLLKLRTDEGSGANRKKPNQRAKRLEIHGDVQLTIAKQLLDLSKDYPQTLAGYTHFWQAAQPIMGDLKRKRAKTLMKRVEKIEQRMERSKGGRVGRSMRRGYNQIMQAWVEGSDSQGTRYAGAGRKWLFGKHTTYLKA